MLAKGAPRRGAGKIPRARTAGGGDENMRVTKVVLGLAGLLLISLVFVSFQAAAHPAASEDGIDKAREKAGTDPPFKGLDRAGFGAESTWPLSRHRAHNPLCSGHPSPGHA